MKTKTFLVGLLCATCFPIGATAAPNEGNTTKYVYRMAGNPYLPLWEHVPDGEPRVFEDPDRPGHYRAYIVGSHDTSRDRYCGSDIRLWSAPVEDLTAWRDDGPIFTYKHNGKWDIMYAPDLVEVTTKTGTKKYYLYPHSRGAGREAMVCVGNRPDGPFTPINLSADGSRAIAGSCMGFDPAVYVEPVDDPADPDYATGWHAWGYWGFQRSQAARLNPATMYSVRDGSSVIRNFLPAGKGYGELRYPEVTDYPCIFPGEDPATFCFFEASSIRRIGNKYVTIYSGYSGPEYGLGSSNSTLRFAYADSPMGPWKSGGVVVDSRAPELNANGTALTATNGGHNTHGSLQLINGQWYVFYHRPPRNFGFARQAMVAPVTIVADTLPTAQGGKVAITGYDPYNDHQVWSIADSRGNTYNGAEVTSEGFHVYGLDPYQFYPAGIACYLSDTSLQQDTWDIWQCTAPVAGVKGGNIVGFKYFGFGGLDKDTLGLKAFAGCAKGDRTRLNLWITPRAQQDITISVWLDGPSSQGGWHGKRIALVTIPASVRRDVMTKRTVDVARYVEGLKGKHALYLKAEGSASAALFDLHGLAFSSKNISIDYPTVPVMTIMADKNVVRLPDTPAPMTEENGYTGYGVYESEYTYSSPSLPTIKATASCPDVKVTINQATPKDSTATVVCDWQGLVKTYKIKLKKTATTALSSMTGDKKDVRSVTFFDLLGQKLGKKQRGLNIERTTLANGLTQSRKILF